MSITWRTATGLTAGADTTAAFADRTATLPTGHSSGDLLILFAGGKPYTTDGSAPTSGEYTSLVNITSGTTGMGAGTGSVRLQVFHKTHDGSEAAPAQTFSAQYSPWMQAMAAASKTNAGSWTVEASTVTAETTSVNVTGGTTLNFETGDHVIVAILHRDDDATHASSSVTIPGCSLGTLTELLTTNVTATGNDGALYVYQAEVTSGTASGAPQFTTTVGGSEGWVAVAFLRIVEPAAEIAATTSDNWGGLTATAAGLHEVPASTSDNWGGLTATADGTVSGSFNEIFGTTSDNWGGLTATAAGLHEVPATTSDNWGGLTATAAGLHEVPATTTVNWGGLTATAAATLNAAGTIASNWGGLTATASGTVSAGPTDHPATASDNWGGLTATSSATVDNPAATADNWGGLTASALGLVDHKALTADNWGGLTATAIAEGAVVDTPASGGGRLLSSSIDRPPLRRVARHPRPAPAIRKRPTITVPLRRPPDEVDLEELLVAGVI